MTIYEYGNPDVDTVLIQLTGDHELSVLPDGQVVRLHFPAIASEVLT